MTIPRTIAIALAAAALAVPGTAQAEPASSFTRDAQVAPRQDLRSPDARDSGRPVLRSEIPPAGQPTWPVHPASLRAPATTAAADTGDSSSPVIPIAAGALGALLAALAAGYGVRRTHRHARIAA